MYNEKHPEDLHDVSEEKFFVDMAENLTMRGTSSADLRTQAAEVMCVVREIKSNVC